MTKKMITLGGVPWEVRVCRMKDYGECIPAKRLIRIRRGLPPHVFVNVLLHEALHGLDFKWDEDCVRQAADELTDALDEFELLA